MKTLNRMHVTLAMASILFLPLVNCGDEYLRGEVSPSRDGKTYLAVVDDNGGGCGPIIVDGEVWMHPLGEHAEVRPGLHTIECGGKIEFTIPEGVVFKFNYWGP